MEANKKYKKSKKKKPFLGPIRWWMLALLVLAMVVSYIDRGNFSMVAPLLTDLFDLDAQKKGYIFSAFLLGYTLMQIPSGRLVDKYGIKWTYAIAYLIWGLTAASFSLATAFWHFLVLRIFLGVTESISGPAGNAYVAKYFREDERGLVNGFLVSGSKIGPAVGAILAGFLIDSYGWRILFLLCGLIPLTWLIPWLLLYTRQEKMQLAPQQSEGTTVKAAPPKKITLAQLSGKRKTWGIFLGYLFYGYVWFLYISWLPSYLYEVLGFSIRESGWWAGFSYGCLTLVVILSGYAADRLIHRGYSPSKTRKGFIVAGFLFGTLILFVPFIQSPLIAMTMVVITISGMGLATANTWAITQTVAPPGTVGTLAGIQNFGATFGGFIAPMVTGYTIKITGSYAPAFVLAGLCMFAGIACYTLLIGKVEPMRIEDKCK
ncbi:MAG: MFS transporter [Prolixibacteraceae bacterium]|nr:MFS transporter [Prolixibacteraceae bacterium]